MDRRYRVTVMKGGPSAEREVSLASGQAVAQALRSRGHDVIELDPRDADWELPLSIDVVFLALHGTYGEDGQIQSRLEDMGVPYTGCGPEASRLAFDKVATKERCIARGLSTPRFGVLRKGEAGWPSHLEPPVVLKPRRQGSSVGLHFVERREELDAALEDAFQFDSELLIEERIRGREVTVGILAGQPLPLVEIRPRSGGYDYRNKYTSGATEYLCPAPFPQELTTRIQEAGVGAFESIGGRDYGRVDVIVREDGLPMVLEVNTLPGMTATSLLPKAALAAGWSYDRLCEEMIVLALQRRPMKPV